MNTKAQETLRRLGAPVATCPICRTVFNTTILANQAIYAHFGVEVLVPVNESASYGYGTRTVFWTCSEECAHQLIWKFRNHHDDDHTTIYRLIKS